MMMVDTSSTGIVNSKSYTILIVDDEPANLATVTEYLAGHGFQVKVGQTGKIGLELARQAQPDLILLDVQLPGIDGFEVCHRLKADEQTQEIPIIFMTVLTGVEDKVKGFEAGGVDYITKPFQEQEVLARVTTHLRLRDLMQVLEEAKESLERRVEKRTTALTQANQGLQAEIAERRRAEAGLKRERALIANIMDTSPVSITVVNHEGQVTFANSQAMQVLGLTTDKITQRTYNAPAWRITDFAGDPFPDEKLPFRQVMTTRQSIYDVQHAIEWPNGRRVLLSINGTPILDEAGQVESVVFALQDITERKQAELERQSHVQFLESMDQINRAMQGTDDLDQMVSDVLDIVLSVFDCDRAFLTHPLDPDVSSWSSVMERTRPEYPGILALEMNEVPMDEKVAQTSRLLLNTDAPLKFGTGNPHSLPTDVSKRLNIKSLMAMALYPKVGKPWQFGIHQCSHARIWTSDEERLFQEIGRRLNDGLTSMLTYRDLYESEFKLAEAERVAHIGYWDRDFNTGRVRISEEARRIFGIYGELTDWFETWIDVVHPDDKERMTEVSKSLFDLLQHSDQYEMEYRLVRPDGDVRYVHSHVEVMRDESGRPQRIFGTIEDITERKKAEMEIYASEQLFRALVENSPDFIARYDVNGQMVYVNPAMEKSLGFPISELLGAIMVRPVGLETALIDETKEYEDAIFEVLKTGQEAEMDLVVPDTGEGKRYHNIRIVAEQGADGAITGVLAIGRDITERKQYEREREAIIAVSTTMRQATTRTAIINIILDQLLNLFDATGSILILPDTRVDGLIVEMGRGVVGEKMSGSYIPPGEGISNWVITNKEPYLTNHADQDPRFYLPELLGDSPCIAAVPLIAQEEAIGALGIVRQSDFGKQDLRLLTAIGDIAANAIQRVTLHERTEQQLHRLSALHQIDLAISTHFDLDIMLDIILKHVKEELGVNAASILLLNPVTHTLDYAAGIGFRTNNIERSQVRIGHGCAGRAVQEKRTVSCLDLLNAPEKLSRSSFLAGEKFDTHYTTPLIIKGQVKGVLELFHRSALDPEHTWLSYFETLATQIAIAIENTSLFENLRQSNEELVLAYDATIEGWSHALDLRDEETEGHSKRVTELALELAEKVGMNEKDRVDLRRGALLHDIGKMGVPDTILRKLGSLTESEEEIMRQHPTYAYQMLSSIKYLNRALEIPYCHHERWDGNGYPRGLKGDEIPLSARIFAVVDVFDALTSDRPYRKAWSHEEAYRYIREEAGKHFDPDVVKIFLERKNI